MNSTPWRIRCAFPRILIQKFHLISPEATLQKIANSVHVEYNGHRKAQAVFLHFFCPLVCIQNGTEKTLHTKMDWRRKNWLIRNQCAIWMLIKLSATERYFSSSLSHTSRSFAISVFTFLFPEANICNNEKKSPHNFRSLCLCSLLNVDAAALPFFQYVNCSTKNKSPSIREKARSAVVIATDANAIYRQCGRDREKRRWMKMCWPIGMSLSVQQSFHSWKRLSAQHITDFLFLDRNLFLFYVRSHSLLHEKNSVRRKMFPSSFDSVVA